MPGADARQRLIDVGVGGGLAGLVEHPQRRDQPLPCQLREANREPKQQPPRVCPTVHVLESGSRPTSGNEPSAGAARLGLCLTGGALRANLPLCAVVTDPRTLQANERTLLAWLRTGASLITLGFAIAKLGEWLRQSGGRKNPTSVAEVIGGHRWFSWARSPSSWR